MASAMRGQPIEIFGQRGTVRDYLYVRDIATAIVSVLRDGRLSETYNIGSGVGLSNMDVIEAMTPLIMEIGCELRVDHLPERAFDVKANVLDSAKLQAHTGWQPRVGFRGGLLLTRDWLRRCEGE
jgi:UDP-glucose 4-epimerase